MNVPVPLNVGLLSFASVTSISSETSDVCPVPSEPLIVHVILYEGRDGSSSNSVTMVTSRVVESSER